MATLTRKELAGKIFDLVHAEYDEHHPRYRVSKSYSRKVFIKGMLNGCGAVHPHTLAELQKSYNKILLEKGLI